MRSLWETVWGKEETGRNSQRDSQLIMVSVYKPGAACSYSSAAVPHFPCLLHHGCRNTGHSGKLLRQCCRSLPLFQLLFYPSWLQSSFAVFFFFYCLQLEITETVLPFHFHGANSKLHSSKMWRRKVVVVEGRVGGTGLVTVSSTVGLPVSEKARLRKAKSMLYFLFTFFFS